MQNFSFKRLTAWLLTFVMLVSLVPANVSASVIDEFLGDVSAYFRSQGDSASASGAMINAATTGMDVETFGSRNSDPVVVIAGSDYQQSGTAPKNNVEYILKAIVKDYETADGFMFGGDYSQTINNATSTTSGINELKGVVQGVYGNALDEIYVQGNHDAAVSGLTATGAHDTGDYGVFSINEDDFSSSYSGGSSVSSSTLTELEDYLNAKVSVSYTKPIFVITHLPLHATSRNDNTGANAIFTKLNAAGEKGLNIIFLFGHNHSQGYDAYLGNGSIYLPKGSSINVAGGSTSTLNFTYMNYGYVGYVSGNADTALTMSVFEITDTQVAVKRYDANGLHNLKAKGVASGSYAADTSEIGTEGAVIELVALPSASAANVTVKAPGITGLSVSKNFGTADDTAYDKNIYTAYASYDINPEGYTQGDSATVTITLDAADGFDASRKVVVIDEEENTEIEKSIVNGTVTFTTNHFSTYDVAQRAVAANVGYTYELVTSIEAGEKYVIVGSDDAVALMDNSGSFDSQTVTISGTALTSDVALTEWTISGTSGGTIVSDQGNGLSYSNSSFNLTGAADNTFNITAVNNNFTILTVRTNSSYSKYYFNYDGSGWTSKPTSAAYVRLYKLTGTGTGTGGTVTPSGGDWKTISDGSGKVVYKLDKDGVDAGSKYLIVSDDEAIAMSAAANSSNGTAIEFNSDETEAYSTSTALEWTIETSDNGYKMYNTEGQYIGRSSSSISNDNSDVWSITGDGEGAYTIKTGNYVLRYSGSNSAFRVGSSSMYSNAIRLYKYDHTDSGVAEYAKLDGELTYTVARDASAEEALAAVMNGVNVVVSADKSAETTLDDSDTNIKWTLASNYDGSTPGEYAVTITYKDVTLGTAKVIVPEATINGITVNPSYGTVTVGASESALVGATITVDVADNEGEDYTVPVTVGMLEGDFDTQTVGEYRNLTVSYNGFTYTGFTLTVKEKVVNNYPSYPNEGAVKVDKTAHGVDFQKTGVTRVELSTSGVPMNQGVDVLLVLDTSSSMGMQGSLTDSGRTRIDVLEECVNALIVNLKKDRLDGSAPDIDIAIVDFNGYTGNKNTNYIGSTARSTSTIGGQLTEGWVNIRTLSDTWADSNIPEDRSGTNYDHGLLQAYDLLKQKQNDNGDNIRKQFVLFMSDGAPFQYNGVNSNSLSSDWENWILGSYTRAQVENLSHVANPEFYYGNNNGNGQKHRVAEAIKGAPDSKFQIVTYSDTSSSGTTKLEEVNGLGATMYSVGLALEATNMPTDVAGQEAILKTIASSDDVFYSVTSAAGLQEAFDDFAGAILYAAENAVFEDQLGEHYNIQLANTTTRLVDGKEFTLDPAPTMEVREYTIWTRAELEDANGNLSEENAKKVGTRKTDVNGNYIYNTLEIVTFNEAGTEAYTDGDTTNIMDNNGVICAETFWYNNGTATVKVDVDGDGTTETDLAPETFIWKVGTIKTKEIALSYYVYLDDSLEGDASAGSYVTNEYAILSYDNYLGNPCSKDTTSPQMAWLAANVSYAYYLVNSEGKPVNANGEEVTFANREVIVHPTIFGEIKLNSIEDVENLTVASTGVLDEGNYALYDYDAKYQLNVNSDATGGWEITVGNGKALSTYVTGFSDTLAFTNATESTSDVDNYDYTHTTVWFAVVWEPRTVEDTVVIDYGLPVEVHVLTNDFFGDFGELIGVAAGTVTNSDNDITTNEIPATGSSLVEGRFGTAQVIKSEAGANESNSVIRYTLNTSNGMQMGATDVFTYSVEYTNTKLHTNNGFYYGTLTIIPATSIYYEETFLTFTNYNGSVWPDESEQTGNGFWSQIQDGYEDDVTQSEDRPGNINFAFDTVIDANNIYGYDPAYSNYTKYSLGQAMKVTVDETTGNGNNAPVASFTFTGRGFDIISLTDKDSGLIIVEYTNKETNVTKKTLVDNYYGYEYLDASVVVYDKDSLAVTENEVSFTVSGKSYKYTNENRNIDYYGYNCPLVSSVSGSDKVYYILASELINSDSEINFWQPVDNTNDTTNTIWQVPVIKIDNLDYAEYTVVIKVAYMSALDHFADGSYSFWMDAVRIYDPANGGAADGTDDTTIEDAYEDDKETYPDYKEIGDLLIAQNDLSTDPATRGVVFIDGRDEVEVAVSDYSNPGPNNEVYLAEGQGIAFSLTASKKPLSTQIGAKLAYGSNGVLMYNGEQLLNNGLSTATDMYYEIEVNWTGDDTNGWTSDVIVLSNGNESTLGTNVISLTNIKNTFDVSGSTVSVGTAAQAAEVGVFMMRRLYTPAPEVFVPETFEVECSSNKNGKNVTVTVKASTDVEYITINGIEMYNYKEKKGVRTWSYKPKNNELADQYEIAAFNTDGLASGIVCVSAEGKSTAYTADSLKQSSETNFATALRDTGVVSEKNAEKMQNLIEKLSNRIFTPEKFVQKLSKISDGSEFMMVNTSEDVEYIIADGEIINNYITETVIDLSNDGEETVNRVWIIPEANADSDIAAYNAEGVTSEAQSNG